MSEMENENLERIDHLIKTKTIEDLTSSESSLIERELGLENFRELSQLAQGLKDEKYRSTSSSVKRDLSAEFKKRNRPFYISILSHKLPVYVQFICLIFLVPLIWILIPEKEIVIENKVTVTVPVHDTITIQLPADTVFIQKEIRVPVFQTKIVEVSPERKSNDTQVKAKNFAEEKTLNELLVSGR